MVNAQESANAPQPPMCCSFQTPPPSNSSQFSYGKSGGGSRGDFLRPGDSRLRFQGHPEPSRVCSVDGFWVPRTWLSLLPSGAGFLGSGKVLSAS